MASIEEIKERTVTDTPLVLFDCELASGSIERWSTHRVVFDGQTYEARVLRHNAFEIRTGSDTGIDSAARISLSLANADSHFSQIERTTGFKGARVTVRFAFFDLKQGSASPAAVLFRGTADAPEEITESALRLSVINSLNLQRILLPDTRIQKRCGWRFPATADQRATAATGGAEGKYSPFWRCGYSADQAGGAGNPDAGGPFTQCDHTRAQCIERGMFSQDSAGRPTRRFGGIEYVPSTIVVRSYGEKGAHLSKAVENEARYNDFVPLVYGRAWYTPPIVFARNDGNLTRMEVLLAAGEIQDVIKVVVNGIDIPAGRAGKDMTATGWFNVVTHGAREGAFNPDFPEGDPYGSLAMMSVVAPNRVSEGRTLPRIEVLADGLRLPQYDLNGALVAETYTNNPAWVLLDLLRRCGWRIADVHLASFARAAAYCAEPIPARDLHGNAVTIPRFQCNLALQHRRSAAEVIRGVRNAARLYLTYGSDGRLEARVENTLALQQPQRAAGSNSAAPLDGGWPAYEFGDGSSAFSGIVRRNGAPAIRVWSRSMAETPNRVTLEFQDAFNEYQQDSVSVADAEDVLRTGQEISIGVPALGAANFHQAARVVRWWLDKAVDGNTFVEFETSVRAAGLQPGDIITLTYLKEEFERQPFRILSIKPGLNFGTALITAQIHKDAWYRDDTGEDNSDAGRQRRSEIGLPRPLAGTVVDEYGEMQFGITESVDAAGRVVLQAAFAPPERPAAGIGIPMLSLAAAVDTTGGSLKGDQTLYYAIAAVDAEGRRTGLSFVVRATVPPGSDTNRVTLAGLSFSAGTAAFDVYRGEWPERLLRIAAAQPVASEFTDTGLAEELVPPPDENYDHANFHWRLEVQPEYQATLHSANTAGSGALGMTVNAWRGMTVRITRGRGAGQERTVASNTATELTIAGTWALEPDETSWFVVAEAGWHFGAASAASPVEFEVPNRTGATVHVSGRAANIHDREAGADVSPVTRWRITGTGSASDADVAPAPLFSLLTRGRGAVELVAVAFPDLTNTRTIASATLTLHYWDELESPSTVELAAAAGAGDPTLSFNTAFGAEAGRVLQIEGEVLRVEEVLSGGTECRVARGVHSSAAAEHAAGTPVYALRRKTFVVPFARDFFGSAASGDFSYALALPDARIASAEMFVTNARGNSATAEACLTQNPDRGLRTGAGGQFSIQVEGWLAVQTAAAPPLVVEQAHAIRDVFAVMGEAPSGGEVEVHVRRDDGVFAVLTIDAGATVSNVVNGFGIAPLPAGARVWWISRQCRRRRIRGRGEI